MYKRLAIDLVKIFNERAYLSIVLDNSIKELKLEISDKKVYTKILYGVCEKRMLIDYNMSLLIKGKRVKPFIKNILRIGVYVIDYMNMKDHYIVNELVKIVKKDDYKSAMFVNGVLRSYQRSEKPSVNNLSKVERVSLEVSLPLELTNLLYKQYKDNLVSFFENGSSLNTYRINTLKTNVGEIKSILDKLNISYDIDNVTLYTRDALLDTDMFKEGLIIAQDASSIRVAEVVNPTLGSSVLDACSAPGGKSLHMAAIMNNTGSITSCDVYEHKLEKINDNAKKLGVSIINTLLADATTYDYNKKFDYCLVDVPCSGLGVISHKPDLKYHITLKDIEGINNLQKKIIRHVKDYVKDGGILVYSTCTINKFENEWLIKDFLNEFKEFVKLEEEIILPSSKGDGFYICKMRKEKIHE
ncbi:MAG: 16S rRNA (cytosine(967)-C(5))-methyltransferase RsmB [Erysipelotrichaceae bacterium]|nr:16S rRNA (cytosine(967)-C(5))-methyltransferase RsmB [Erysipelotrichaceae bacterium]